MATATTRPMKLGQPFTRWSIRKLAAFRASPECGLIQIGRKPCAVCPDAAGSPSSAPRPGKSPPTPNGTPPHSRCHLLSAHKGPALLHTYLRWRNANARHPDILAAQRRERARIRSEKGIRWRHRATHYSGADIGQGCGLLGMTS